MKIGILGSGMIGGTAARLFIKAGHEVAVGNSRGPESLRPLAAELGPKLHPTTIEGAAHFGHVVLLAVPWRATDALPVPSLLKGKIVVDAMNPYTPDGGTYDLGDSTSSEEVEKRLPGARLVKAFNTIYFKTLASQGKADAPLDDRLAIFVAGDDQEAKAVVSRLIEEIGFAAIDTGGLRDGGKRQEPGSPIYNRMITAREARELLSRG